MRPPARSPVAQACLKVGVGGTAVRPLGVSHTGEEIYWIPFHGESRAAMLATDAAARPSKETG